MVAVVVVGETVAKTDEVSETAGGIVDDIVGKIAVDSVGKLDVDIVERMAVVEGRTYPTWEALRFVGEDDGFDDEEAAFVTFSASAVDIVDVVVPFANVIDVVRGCCETPAALLSLFQLKEHRDKS